MSDGKQAALAAIQQINAVEGFDPTPLAVEYTDLNTKEKRLKLPVMVQIAWFRLKIRRDASQPQSLRPRTVLLLQPGSIPITPIRPTSIWPRQRPQGAIWRICRQCPQESGRRQPR